MSAWTVFMLLSVTALWAGMLGAVAYLVGAFPARRYEGTAAAEASRQAD